MALSSNTGWGLHEVFDMEIEDIAAALEALKSLQPDPPRRR